MSYLDWLEANWQKGSTYRRATADVERIKADIEKVKQGIERAERGEIPDESHWLFKDRSFMFSSAFDTSAILDSLTEGVFGLPKGRMQQDRWEKEALEAETKRTDGIQRWLTVYRDGESFFPQWDFKPETNSLPELQKALPVAEKRLTDCGPEPVYDWRSDDKESKAWYEESQYVLTEMLRILGWSSHYDFNENLANFINDMTEDERMFRFAHWTHSNGFCTCRVTHAFVPKKKVTRSGWTIWSATLASMLDFIDVHWEILLEGVQKERERIAVIYAELGITEDVSQETE